VLLARDQQPHESGLGAMSVPFKSDNLREIQAKWDLIPNRQVVSNQISHQLRNIAFLLSHT
jgi:hypothetical protein